MNKLKNFMTWLLLLAASHVMAINVTVDAIEIEPGKTAQLVINLNNSENDLTAYQMFLYLPDGVTVQKKANGKYAYTTNGDRHDGAFTVSVKDAEGGGLLITCFSADKDVITGTSGELIRLPLEVASTVSTSLQASLKNMEFSDVNAKAYKPADVTFNLTLKGGDTPPEPSSDVLISVPDLSVTAGGTADLVIDMATELTNLTAYQMFLYLPDGVTVQKKANGKYAYTTNGDRHDGAFTVSVKDAEDGGLLITCFSADKDVISGTSGELIRLPLEVASTVSTSLQASLKNMEFSDVNAKAYKPADVTFNLRTLPTPKKLTLSASPIGGAVAKGTTITLTATADGSSVYDCDIRYTLDGSIPTKSSTQYNSAITINSDCTLRAIAYKTGYETSDVLTEYYSIIPAPDFFTSKTQEGIDISFQVISSSNKTCQVMGSECMGLNNSGTPYYPAIDQNYSGTITIPSEVNGYKVVKIGETAFSSCSLKSIEFMKTLPPKNKK